MKSKIHTERIDNNLAARRAVVISVLKAAGAQPMLFSPLYAMQRKPSSSLCCSQINVIAELQSRVRKGQNNIKWPLARLQSQKSSNYTVHREIFKQHKFHSLVTQHDIQILCRQIFADVRRMFNISGPVPLTKMWKNFRIYRIL